MCGRYALYADPAALKAEFATSNEFPTLPRYNLTPGAFHAVIRQQADGERRVIPARWGLLPSWVTTPGKLAQPINAKSETAAGKPMFRHALARRRIIVPASGWYEWKTEQGRKQPYFFSRADGDPLAFAGLLEHWSGFEGEVETYAILTAAANPLAATVHDRMPVILEAADYARWLDPALVQSKAVLDLMVPAANEVLQVWPVSRRVNRPVEDDAALVTPVMTGTDAFTLE
jgi:putative SOS response-associated peptidase YedK